MESLTARTSFVTHDDELTGWDEYVAVAASGSLNPDAMELYRRWWDLADTAIYVDLFRRPHERTADTVASWENFAVTIEAAATGK